MALISFLWLRGKDAMRNVEYGGISNMQINFRVGKDHLIKFFELNYMYKSEKKKCS